MTLTLNPRRCETESLQTSMLEVPAKGKLKESSCGDTNGEQCLNLTVCVSLGGKDSVKALLSATVPKTVPVVGGVGGIPGRGSC